MAVMLTRRRITILCIGLLIAAVLAGGWWVWFRPRPLRLAAVLPGEHFLGHHVVRAGGFLTRDDGYRYRFYGWDARPRWEVTPPAFRFAGHDRSAEQIRAVIWHPGALALSTDGRRLALAVPDGAYLRLCTWRDGQPETDVRIAVSPRMYDQATCCPVRLALARDGTVWCAIPGTTSCRLVAARGRRILANGRYAYHFKQKSLETYISVALLPDIGRMAVSNYVETEVVKVTQSGGTLRGSYRVAYTSGLEYALPNGYLMMTDGQWMDARHGTLQRGTQTYVFNGGSILECENQPITLFSPATGQRRRLPDRLNYCGLSASGRYVVAQDQFRLSTQGRELASELDRVIPGLLSALERREEASVKMLITTPKGRQLAYMKLEFKKHTTELRLPRPATTAWDHIPAVQQADYLEFPGFLAVLSPDGHTLVSYIDAPTEGVVVFRW